MVPLIINVSVLRDHLKVEEIRSRILLNLQTCPVIPYSLHAGLIIFRRQVFAMDRSFYKAMSGRACALDWSSQKCDIRGFQNQGLGFYSRKPSYCPW